MKYFHGLKTWCAEPQFWLHWSYLWTKPWIYLVVTFDNLELSLLRIAGYYVFYSFYCNFYVSYSRVLILFPNKKLTNFSRIQFPYVDIKYFTTKICPIPLTNAKFSKGSFTYYISTLGGRGVREMLMISYVGGRGGWPNAYVSKKHKLLKLQEMKQEPLNEKKQKKNFNCNFIFQEKFFVFILYLLVNFFKGTMFKNEKIYTNNAPARFWTHNLLA